MKKEYFFLILLFVPCIAMLSGCGNAKKSLGLVKESPDEFAVIKRAPLAMPPSIALPPPKPGAPRPQEQAPDAEAKQAVFGGEAVYGSSSQSAAETTLLQKTGGADPNIRRKIDSEQDELAEKNRPVIKRILNIGQEDSAAATVVNPQEELERLRKNKEEGKPVTEGETPIVKE